MSVWTVVGMRWDEAGDHAVAAVLPGRRTPELLDGDDHLTGWYRHVEAETGMAARHLVLESFDTLGEEER